ncbi:MAG: sigma 54-interacting transcriptional regulator, partial [Planctomycetes bacterium]|nr:sigma 54-interacting transcriptional regulator [Planctomycetota bacterium]
AKILHAIEYKEFQRVGGEQTLRADVRVIAASNKDLSRAMETGAFRRDLFYRLAEATLRIPPLRERKEDIPSLVARMISECNRKFHKAVTGATPQVLALLAAHHWPGNVRELRAVIRRACAVAPSVVITPAEIDLFAGDVAESDAPPAAAPRPPAAAMAMGNGAEPALSLAAMERDHIARVLALTSWNKKEAARTLEISRPTLDRKIRQYGLARE